MRAVVITCSDSAAAGASEDLSGPLAAELLAELGHEVATPVIVVPDDAERITAAVRHAIADGARVVVTTGGTGPGPRDVTPEALAGMGVRELPGLGEAMRASARDRVPATDLSRGFGGIVDRAVVLALPGSPGGVRDGLAAVGGLLGHAAAAADGAGHATHGRAPARGVAAASASASGPTPAPSSLADRRSSDDAPANSGEGMGGGDAGGAGAGISSAPITEGEAVAEIGTPHAGAIVTFVGVVRDHDHDRAVTALHYEGHPDAGRVLADVLAEARQHPGVLGAAARHRVGELAIGDVAFVAAISAAHRREAFAACAWLVDEAKARLPIWKHQFFADGTDEWVNCP